MGSSEVVVQPSGWCDYVFEDKYKRMSFEDQIKYYTQNKHLKEIPTAKEIETSQSAKRKNQRSCQARQYHRVRILRIKSDGGYMAY